MVYSEEGELSCCETADDGPTALEELTDLIWLHFCLNLKYVGFKK